MGQKRASSRMGPALLWAKEGAGGIDRAACRGTPPILREFPVQVPGGMPMFERLLDLPGDPEAFAQAAPRCPVFRLDHADADPVASS
jgi:hypothetical protein